MTGVLDLLSAPPISTTNHLRAFSTTSVAHRVPPEHDDEDSSPWGQLDASVEEWERSRGQSQKQPQTHSSGLAADEQMWLDAMNAKLDRADRMQGRQAATAPEPTYAAAPRIHYPAQSDTTTSLSAEEKRWLDGMNAQLSGGADMPAPPTYDGEDRLGPGRVVPRTAPAQTLTHIDSKTNQPTMVNISSKAATARSATAVGRVYIPRPTLELLTSSATGDIDSPSGKGPVFSTARLAGILAAKKTSDLIPLCHNVPLDGVDVHFDLIDPADEDLADMPYIHITATSTTRSATGVEMEALTAVQVSALTVWDMLKAVAGKQMSIGGVCVVEKSGGKSGDWVREKD